VLPIYGGTAAKQEPLNHWLRRMDRRLQLETQIAEANQ